jgi:NitT/TauT family transport system permease protein
LDAGVGAAAPLHTQAGRDGGRQWLAPFLTHALPIATVAAALVVLWYLLAVALNWQVVSDAQSRAGATPDFASMVGLTLNHARPLLPAPHQIADEVWRTVFTLPVDSRRSLVNHGWVTLSAALVGFGIGSLAGMLIAVAITHLRSLERSLMPWIIASQAIPVLALAPIVIVALGTLGLEGLLPKALIAAYLCFFPVAIAMVKGLAAADRLALDLMRTYSASRAQGLLVAPPADLAALPLRQPEDRGLRRPSSAPSWRSCRRARRRARRAAAGWQLFRPDGADLGRAGRRRRHLRGLVGLLALAERALARRMGARA